VDLFCLANQFLSSELFTEFILKNKKSLVANPSYYSMYHVREHLGPGKYFFRVVFYF
jgi:hypothetical protein